ncbi:MAG TPA: type II secretion system protein GspN [Polyangiaceae bacterium]
MTREEWRSRLRAAAAIAGYPAFYLICVFTFTSLTFPYETLKQRIVLAFNAQQRAAGAPQELQIDELTSSWVTGVKAIGVHLTRPSSDGKSPPEVLSIDEARARISLLPLLIGHRTFTFVLKGFGGEIDGSYQESGKDRHVSVDVDAIDVGTIEPLTTALGLPLEGHLSGTVDFDLPEGKATKGSGTVAFEGTDLAVGDGKAKLKGALALPRLTIGNLSMSGEAKDGVLKISKLGASGKDLDLAGDGRILMRDIATESICDVQLRFKINDVYRGKTDVTKNLFGAPGSPKGGDVELFVPQMKAAKRPDGFYGFHVRGLLGKPDFEPSPSGASPSSASGASSGGGSSGSGGGMDNKTGGAVSPMFGGGGGAKP